MTTLLLNLILMAVLVASATPPLIHSQPYQWTLTKLRLNRKPMNCSECFSMWIQLILQLTYFQTPFPLAMLTALTTAWLANQLDKLHQQL